MKSILKQLLLLLLTSFLPAQSFAQSPPPKSRLEDKQAVNIMNNAAKQIQSYRSLHLKFNTANKDTKGKIIETQRGELTLSGNKYKGTWNGYNIFCDGKETWLYQQETNEVHWNTYDPKAEDVLNIPKLIAGYAKQFRPKLIREDKINGVTVQVLDLIPLHSQEYHKIRISIRKTNSELASLEVLYKNGITAGYNLEKWTPNVPVKDNDFRFSASNYPGVEVIDLR